MYEFPIKIIYEQLQTRLEGGILKAVMRTDLQVDKEELIRALQYDRDQYERGFTAGYMAAEAELVRCKDCKHLNILNRKEIYAHCPKTNTAFLPFDLDTRTHFCSLGERKDNEK